MVAARSVRYVLDVSDLPFKAPPAGQPASPRQVALAHAAQPRDGEGDAQHIAQLRVRNAAAGRAVGAAREPLQAPPPPRANRTAVPGPGHSRPQDAVADRDEELIRGMRTCARCRVYEPFQRLTESSCWQISGQDCVFGIVAAVTGQVQAAPSVKASPPARVSGADVVAPPPAPHAAPLGPASGGHANAVHAAPPAAETAQGDVPEPRLSCPRSDELTKQEKVERYMAQVGRLWRDPCAKTPSTPGSDVAEAIVRGLPHRNSDDK